MRIANAASPFTGSPVNVVLALLVVVVAWLASGPLFKLGDTCSW